MEDVKKRRIRKEDWTKIEQFVKRELDKRESSQYRKDHEEIWREIDRQLKMKPMQRIDPKGQPLPKSWHSTFELGELSKASEIISADVRRITFPFDRSWFEAHIEIPLQTTPKGPVKADTKKQKQADGTLRSFMVQQHVDFGFKARADLSIKEALHHGGYVAEVDVQSEMMVYEGSKLAQIKAPVWIAHSMWNCFPDESPSVEGTSMFYTGSMIIRKYMPLYKLKQMKGEGWMPSQFSKVPKKEKHKDGDIETEDVQLLYYWGDISIDRSEEDIYLPNCKVIVANGIIVYYAPNELPFPPIIYGGYERQDPRDPYYTSPLIKQSPIQKIATICANKFIDAVALHTEPPIVYDGMDPYFVENDGPVIAPGAKTGSKGSTDFKEIKIGDPNAALEGLQMCLRQMQEGTGVSAIRSGVQNSDRQTATEVTKVAQGAEVRTIDFIDKFIANLRTFLYMQHELNKRHCDKYSFYNSELGTPDFIRITKKQIPESVHFEIVGAKGVLGEEQRANRTAAVTAFAAATPGFAELLKRTEILLEMYQDAGNKNPERLVEESKPQIPPQVAMQMQQMQQAMGEMQKKLQDAELKLKDKSQDQAIKGAVAKQDLQQDAESHMQDMAIKRAESFQELKQHMLEFMQETRIKAQEAKQKKKGKIKAKKATDGSWQVESDGEVTVIKKTPDGFVVENGSSATH